ncbi:ROK family transcriptional regulator [Kitasatospora sp. SUK 42]|uniref:ROK family transcriptional regulator n=1 Tax=Kitasatospora sp. SUK 42 TaxID=1588882 RepID=UPI0018CA9CC7|nr:ROK family transcriptional regulator [Kitasatospora sp. SUK 42]MBV2153114.1 ROK family protein [Kitasatospora sp. SUK 42]
MPPTRTPATATTQTVAQVNQTVLLEVLRRHGSLSRQRLAAESGLSTATVHRLVEVLRAEGLVEVEAVRAPSSGGRPPQLIRYNARAQTVLAVAMRPRRIVGVVADLDGTVLHEAEHHWAFPGPDGPRETTAAELTGPLLALVDDLRAWAGRHAGPPRALVAGVPGVVRDRTGLVEFAPALEWPGLRLGALLQERYGVPVAVESNVNLVALAVQQAEEASGVSDLAAVVVGIEVGAGIVLDGRLHRGRLGAAGALGHLMSGHAALDRPLGRTGDTQARIGDHAVDRRITEAGLTVSGTPAERVAELFRLGREGHPAAVRLIGELTDDLALLVANLSALLAPELIALGGRLFWESGGELPAAIESRLQGRVPVLPRLVVVHSTTTELVGAAAAAVRLADGATFITR